MTLVAIGFAPTPLRAMGVYKGVFAADFGAHGVARRNESLP
jgi:hypothetical protein